MPKEEPMPDLSDVESVADETPDEAGDVDAAMLKILTERTLKDTLKLLNESTLERAGKPELWEEAKYKFPMPFHKEFMEGLEECRKVADEKKDIPMVPGLVLKVADAVEKNLVAIDPKLAGACVTIAAFPNTRLFQRRRISKLDASKFEKGFKDAEKNDTLTEGFWMNVDKEYTLAMGKRSTVALKDDPLPKAWTALQKSWNELAGKIKKLKEDIKMFEIPDDFRIQDFMAEKSLEGYKKLFAEEEETLRKDPAGASKGNKAIEQAFANATSEWKRVKKDGTFH